MDQLTVIAAKIRIFFEEKLCEKLPELIEKANEGDLLGLEEQLWGSVASLYGLIASEALQASARASESTLREKARQSGLRKLEWRTMQVQIKTGHYVAVPGLYAKQAPKGWRAPRHLLCSHWKLLKGATPAYYGTAGLFGVLCPSFEVASHVLGHLGIRQNRDRLQKLAGALAQHCKDAQPELALKKGETLRGKRVLIGIDGGRTRMREYTGQANKAGNPKFSTPWMEPKMFVVEVLDDKGQIERSELPIYGCRFGDDELISLLMDHLKALGIRHAKQVQVVADGAAWIWNRVKKRLRALGVAAKKIVETVDYFHAAEYVHSIAAALPGKLKARSARILRDFKKWLWQGQIEKIIEKCREYFARPSQEIARWINYLDKHKERMRYAELRSGKLACGSGVIESGIRRVINLRFKNASAFWHPENVEALYFLRGILLSYRWDIFMGNLMRQ